MEYAPAPHTSLFCTQCGQSVVYRNLPGDEFVRCVCEKCKIVHYENPKLIVGTIPYVDGKVLLCRRAIEPRKNYWTLPAGFMELGDDTTSQGARRETFEESGAKVCITDLFSIAEVPLVHQVHLYYLAQILDMQSPFGDETLEVQLFSFADIPWKELAFQTVEKTLRAFISDTESGNFSLHHFTVSTAMAGQTRARQ